MEPSVCVDIDQSFWREWAPQFAFSILLLNFQDLNLKIYVLDPDSKLNVKELF